MMEVDHEDQVEMHRIVHLDLKGAPPKLSYIEQLLPLLRKWGATGLLVEYEDMFPYSGSLSDLPATNAYTASDVRKLQDMAKSHGLIVIPLLQTFGHMEFVLKHGKFHKLREVPRYPMSLCPTHPEALILITSMIDQQMALHPETKWLHIGADEVFHLGLCSLCQSHMEQNNVSAITLFLQHVVRVLHYIRDKYPGVRPVMWDDMLRDISEEALQERKLGELVDLMVWNYSRVLEFPPGMWQRYSSVFNGLWVASAFKGATGPCMYVTDVAFHVENHCAWLTEVKQRCDKFTFRGYCLTGWQRYDHLAVLCELLPVGLPCLAACLLTLGAGAFSSKVHEQCSTDLGFTALMPMVPYQKVGFIPECTFPGHEIYRGALILLHLEHLYNIFTNNDRLCGWMSPYHVQHRYVNPAHVEHILQEGNSLVHQMEELSETLKSALNEKFFPEVAEEWLSVFIHPKTAKVKDIVLQAAGLIQHGSWPKDSMPDQSAE